MEWNARTTTIAIARKLLRATLDRAVGIPAPMPIDAGGMAAHWRDWPPMKLALRPHQIALDCYPIIPLRGNVPLANRRIWPGGRTAHFLAFCPAK